jgi:hypothetical protein
MDGVKDPKASGAIIHEPEAAGTPIESEDPTGEDAEGAPANPETADELDVTEQPIPDPFFWPEERIDVAGGPGPAMSAPTSEREEIDEIMARAMRLRSVEANKIITNPAHIQSYVETCWMEELPAAQAAHAALDAAGYSIVRDAR